MLPWLLGVGVGGGDGGEPAESCLVVEGRLVAFRVSGKSEVKFKGKQFAESKLGPCIYVM